MKKIIKYSMLFISVVVITASCKKDFLNTEPLTAFSDIAVWSDPILIQTFIDGIYSNLNNPANGGDGVLKGEFVDEMHDQWYSFFDFNNSLLTPDNNNANWFHENWAKLYKNVRACNLFFDKIDGVTTFDNTLTNGVLLEDRMKGEVHFLRANLYSQLVSLYGGVPLVKIALGLNDEVSLPRDTYADCIQFIVDECDAAASLLPIVESGKNQGRVTKGAALTLKTRVLLSAASDFV
ncbi:MAG: RagB/SusD family nutrient uptake outer membrane protein [Ginsengibacter sp.]